MEEVESKLATDKVLLLEVEPTTSPFAMKKKMKTTCRKQMEDQKKGVRSSLDLRFEATLKRR